MQSTNIQLHRVDARGLDLVIELVRDLSHTLSRISGRPDEGLSDGDALRSVNEFLLRPARQLLADLTAAGAVRA